MRLLSSLAAALMLMMVVSGCRNDIVGEPPLPDAGFEGEGEAGEGEGEGESCDGDGVAAISIRLDDNTRFIRCDAGTVTVTDGDFSEVARVVVIDADAGECRHQAGFRRPGTYAVAIAVPNFVTRNVTLTAAVGDNPCGDPVTTSLSLTLQPQ